MLAGFENEVLKLPWVGIWRKFSQLFGGYLHCLPLVRFFFAHKELDHILRQQPFTVGLVHSPCLRIRWRAVVDLTLHQHIPLAVFIEIGQLHADRERNFLLVHLFQQFRDEVGQANIALHLPAAVCIGNIIPGLVANLSTSDSLMGQCFHFQLVSIRLFTGQDTLLSPQHWDDQPFELIVSNPPFSVPWEGDKNPLLINDPRFSPAGVLAPASKGDMAFIMHSLSWLASNGAAAIVCFPGIMYRGGAEQKIRKYLVDNNFVDAIIQLPSNLFLNVTISVDIMLLKKNKTDNAVLFVDASKEFVKVTKNNRLSDTNIRRIVSAVAERKDEQHFARLVPNDEVGSKQNNYNLSVSTYVEQEDTREKIDIVKLNAEIAEIVAREQKLREEIDRIIGEIEG